MPEIIVVYVLGFCTLVIFGIVARTLLALPGFAPKAALAVGVGLLVVQGFVVASGSERHAAALFATMIALGLWFSPTSDRESLPFD